MDNSDSLRNLESLRLVAVHLPRVRDPEIRAAIAHAALWSIATTVHAERAPSLHRALALLRRHLRGPEDRAA